MRTFVAVPNGAGAAARPRLLTAGDAAAREEEVTPTMNNELYISVRFNWALYRAALGITDFHLRWLILDALKGPTFFALVED